MKACPSEETLRNFCRVEVKDSKELEKVARWLNAPILECDVTKEDLVLDVRNRLCFYKKSE